MKLGNEVLAEAVENMKYAKWIETEQRKETWDEICDRNRNMHLKHLKQTLDLDEDTYTTIATRLYDVYDNFVKTRKILPSMRSMQFGGKPIEVSPNRIYNCAFLPIDSTLSFSEAMFLLLGGTGVGFSVQKHHIDKLPVVRKPSTDRTYRYKVADTIEGWAEAIRVLFDSYTGKRTTMPRFDYSDIRPKGARLKTTGGNAPGPEPLKKCIVIIQGMFNEMEEGHKIKPIEAHDMMCYIADTVLSGGIRRSALISLFSADDREMINAKAGNFAEEGNAQRYRANNSAVVLRHRVTEDFFKELMSNVANSHSGEPGVYLTNDKDWGTNPCVEIGLRPYQFCNLCEVNVSNVENEEDLLQRVEAATVLGTVQATYTDFHYLREVWRRNTEKDALIGISMTGIASNKLMDSWYSNAALLVKVTNATYAKMLGINEAARTTCVKPAGTTSCVLGTSSGIHAWYGKYYIRSVRVGKSEAIYPYLLEKLPDLVEDEIGKEDESAVLSIPQTIPYDYVTTRADETALDMLERVKFVSENWVKTGHRRGNNGHNVSATVYVKPTEWKEVTQWLWDNRHSYNGMSFLPYHGGEYKQAPFEEIDEERYNKMVKKLHPIDLTEVIELEDTTNLQGEIACAGGACEV